LNFCKAQPLRPRVGLALLALVFLAWPGCGAATDFDPLFYGNDDFGDVGLMATPTARMRPDGEFAAGVSTVRPYNQIDIAAQVLPWLESSFHYVDITNRSYSDVEAFSGNQHYKHRGVDFKIRLLNEGTYRPSIAIGAMDLGGTGLFAAEYLVSSYHFYDFDFSFGLGWDRLGSRGGIRNPFALISSHFNQSCFTGDNTPGGLNSSRLFCGHDVGPFGGVEWNTPLKGLVAKVEYDGNDYQHESLDDNQKVNSPVNFGLSYRGLKSLDLGVGLERGNIVMGRVTLYTNYQTLRGVLKSSDPQPVAVPQAPVSYVGAAAAQPATNGAANGSGDAPLATRVVPLPQSPITSVPVPLPAPAPAPVVAPLAAKAPAASSKEQEQAFVLALKKALKEQGFVLIAVDYDSFQKEVRVWLRQDRYRNPAKAVGRTARVLSATAPAEVSKFTLVFVDAGVENYRAEISRADFEKAVRGEADFDAAVESVHLRGPGDGYGSAEYYDASRFPKLSWDTGPAVRQSIGGPNGFYYGQLYWKVEGGVELTDHLGVSAAAGFNIINNFNQITLQSNSTLPHVRSDIVQYLQQGANGIINLESDYIWSPLPDVYHRMSLGIFEEMYGGVATEFLYRPYGRSWAVAFDVNRVKQRGFDEMFDFLPYEVTTGHATLYYKPGYYNLLFKLSAGQYLARDRGATIDVSRQFDSGVRLGLFATKTNVPAAEFGEGSFDKGAYITLPLDLFFAQSTRREAGFAFRPLTRDGGQMVYDGPELYYTVTGGQPDDFANGASELLK
jgi:hypothetical protein